MAQLAEITINRVQVGVRKDDDAGVFVGFSPRFQVYSQGDTNAEALEAVTGAIVLRLTTAFEHGRIDKVLRQAGFEPLGLGAETNPLPPSGDDEFVEIKFTSDVKVTEVGIRVPLGAFIGQGQLQCHH